MYRNTSVSILWELKAQSRQGIITCIDCYEYNGEDHLLIGRQSGSVEIYSLETHCIPIEKYAYVILVYYYSILLKYYFYENNN